MWQFIFLFGIFIFVMSCQTMYDNQKVAPDIDAYLNTFKDSIPIDNPYAVMGLGYQDVYIRNNERGNALMRYGLSKLEVAPTYEDYHALSVQNTKNGNYNVACQYLDTAATLNPEVYGYYGWIMLYYYRDYKRSLEYLDIYDKLTPGFRDNPAGEDIDFLRGLALMQMGKYDEAISAFSTNISNVTAESDEEWVNIYAFFYKGRCLHHQENYTAAISFYNKTLQYYYSSAEAYFYKGLAEQSLGNDGSKSLNKALTLCLQKNKQSDSYVELFDEVYPSQIRQSINDLK